MSNGTTAQRAIGNARPTKTDAGEGAFPRSGHRAARRLRDSAERSCSGNS